MGLSSSNLVVLAKVLSSLFSRRFDLIYLLTMAAEPDRITISIDIQLWTLLYSMVPNQRALLLFTSFPLRN